MKTALLWFRQDLRLNDNPALRDALASADRVIPVYIHAPVSGATWPMGAAGRWWLHHSLHALATDLAASGSRLVIRRGASFQELARLLAETGATAVYWNRQYEPSAVARDSEIKRVLRGEGFSVATHNAALWYEPWEIQRGSDQPHQVFTPFWKALLKRGLPMVDATAPTSLPAVEPNPWSVPLESLDLLPRIAWDQSFYDHWQPGESGAWKALRRFIAEAMTAYADKRDVPALTGTSRLSPHLHFGEIGPRQIATALAEFAGNRGADAFLRELGWREFAHHLLFHFPQTTDEPLDQRFVDFPWQPDSNALRAWQRGQTGVPLVDAGMRELWATGWMHNRIRMVVGSYLTKNLLLPWQSGARWFWDTLLDADLANNTLGWQWIAGCGADAAPYFRIFNPVLQGERFDPAGAYVRRWVPELAKLPDTFIHRPWEAPPSLLEAVGVRLGTDYPLPLIDLPASRERALAAFAEIKTRSP